MIVYRRLEDGMERLAERKRLCQHSPRAGRLGACQPSKRKRVLRAEQSGMVCPGQQIAVGVKVFPSIVRSAATRRVQEIKARPAADDGKPAGSPGAQRSKIERGRPRRHFLSSP